MIQYTKGRCCYDTKEKLAMIKKVLGNNIGRKVSLTIRRSKEEYVEIKGIIEDVLHRFLLFRLKLMNIKKELFHILILMF